MDAFHVQNKGIFTLAVVKAVSKCLVLSSYWTDRSSICDVEVYAELFPNSANGPSILFASHRPVHRKVLQSQS